MRFDNCLMNPPFFKGVGEKMLESCLEISDKVVTVQPIPFIIGKRKNKHIVDMLWDSGASIEFIKSAKYFDGTFLSDISIVSYGIGDAHSMSICNGDSLFYVTDPYSVRPYMADPLLVRFKSIIDPLLVHTLSDHAVFFKKDDPRYSVLYNGPVKPIIRFSGIRAHIDQTTGEKCADFYTIVSNDPKEQKAKSLIDTSHLYDIDRSGNHLVRNAILFDDTVSRDACFRYIQTYFCRACLMLVKTNAHLDSGELDGIPMFDFHDEHFQGTPSEIDHYLFDKYDIPIDIQDHLMSLLPDYYNIR